MNLVDELHAIGAALASAQIPYAVCGGVAVTAYGATRSTKDIDIVVTRDDLTRVLDVVRPLGSELLMRMGEGGRGGHGHIEGKKRAAMHGKPPCCSAKS